MNYLKLYKELSTGNNFIFFKLNIFYSFNMITYVTTSSGLYGSLLLISRNKIIREILRSCDKKYHFYE